MFTLPGVTQLQLGPVDGDIAYLLHTVFPVIATLLSNLISYVHICVSKRFLSPGEKNLKYNIVMFTG